MKLTNYGSFLEQFPPEFECEIVDDTSWSCEHGIERWRSNCSCNMARPAGIENGARPCDRPSTNCAMRSLNLLSVKAASFSKTYGLRATRISMWCLTAARNLRTASSTRNRLMHSRSPERVRALELMELQRHAQLMYTSCGWFFDDISGIETVQVIAYAARVLQLAKQLFGQQAAPLEPAFVARMAEAHSNVPEAGDGASIYKKCADTMELGLSKWRHTTRSARFFFVCG